MKKTRSESGLGRKYCRHGIEDHLSDSSQQFYNGIERDALGKEMKNDDMDESRALRGFVRGPDDTNTTKHQHRNESQPETATKSAIRESSRLEKALVMYDFEEVLWMIDAGEVPVDTTVANGENALTKACGCGETEVVKVLIQHGANLNHMNNGRRTPLMKAAAGGYVDIVELLLSHTEVDVFRKDESSKTALDWARLGRHRECVDLLERFMDNIMAGKRRKLKNKARLKVLNENVLERNQTLTAKMRELIRSCDMDAIKILVSECNISYQAYERAVREIERIDDGQTCDPYCIHTSIEGGMTALFRACSENRGDLIALLVHHGARIDEAVLSNGKHNPLSWACACGQLESVKMLLALGAKIDFVTPNEGKTPLIHAICNFHNLVVMTLVDCAVDRCMQERRKLIQALKISETDQDALLGVKDWTRFLEDFLDQKDAKGRTARDYANLVANTDANLILDEAEMRIKERQTRLNREKEATKPTECRNGCGFVDRADRIFKHERWKCDLRSVQCEQLCGASVPASKMDLHLERYCENRLVRCRNVYLGCEVKMKKSEIEGHELHKCKFRVVKCRLGCGEECAYQDLPVHEEDKCPLRVVQCNSNKYPEGCNAYMQWHLMAHHLQHACPNRLVTCRVGCKQKIRYREREHHEEQVCKRPCSLGCGEIIGPEDRRKIHELHFCDRRVVTCRHGCGIQNLQERHRMEHETGPCLHKPVPCPLHCGETLQVRLVEQHITGETGTCPNRMLPCQLDYVGKRVRIRFLKETSGSVGYVLSYDDNDKTHRIQFGTDTKTLLLTKDVDYVEPLDINLFDCGLMQACDREKHINTNCLHRKTFCPNQCGQVMATEVMAQHLKDGCVKRMVVCSNNGCNQELFSCDKWRHEMEECKFQKVKCSCGEFIDRFEVENHANVNCKAAKVRCILGCSQYVPRGDMEHHVSEACPKRVVPCRFGCGIEQMWAEESEEHENKVCDYRLVRCEQCDTSNACVAKDLAKHQTTECARRPIECACGETIPLDEMKNHSINLCKKRLRWCALGCRERVPDDVMEHHEEKECRLRVELCPQGCGEAIRLDFVNEHMEKQCRKRSVACPLKCGETYRMESLQEHVDGCLHRIVPCAAQSDGCRRKILTWLTGDLFYGAGRLVLCEGHQESVLSYAAKVGDVPLLKSIISQIQRVPPEGADEVRVDTLNGSSNSNSHSLSTTSSTSSGSDRSKPSKKLGRKKPIVKETRDKATLERLMREKMSDLANQESLTGHSALTHAASMGQLEVLQMFHDLGTDFNRETSRGRTLLLEAVRHGHIEVVSFLVKQAKVIIDYKSKTGMTAIALAQRLGNKGITILLEEELQFQMDLSRLYAGICCCNLDDLDKLLENGEPYFLNQEQVLSDEVAGYRDKIERLEKEEIDLVKESEQVSPLYHKKLEQFQQAEANVANLGNEIDALVVKYQKMDVEEWQPVLQVTLAAVQFIRDNDLRNLATITEPSPLMAATMEVICTLLGIPPEKVRDPLKPLREVDDFWIAGRKNILNQKASALKKQMAKALSSGFLEERLILKCRPVVSKIHSLVSRPIVDQMDELRRELQEHHDDNDEEGNNKEGFDQDDVADDDAYHALKAFIFYCNAADLYSSMVRGQIFQMKENESQLRLQKSRAEIELENARTALKFADNKLKNFTDPLEDVQTELEQCRKDLEISNGQLYCTRLLSARTLAGHTALSWAAIYGDARIGELLLDRGANVEYEDDQRNIAASLIQLLIRYHLNCKRRPTWQPHLSKQFQTEDFAFYFALKDLVSKHRGKRFTSRSPLAHAVYNGHREFASLLINFGANIHRENRVLPVGPVPFMFPSPWEQVNTQFRFGQLAVFAIAERNNKDVEDEEGIIENDEKRSEEFELEDHMEAMPTIMDTAIGGVTYQGCKTWEYQVGWTERGRNQICLEYIQGVWDRAQRQREYVLEAEKLRKAREQEAEKMGKLNQKFKHAVLFENFNEVLDLVEAGATIDFELKAEGHTALSYASWRGTEADNKDGDRVLAVELLLDRKYKIPNVNRETTAMHTALSYASKAGRLNVIQALLDRGAKVNQVLRDGKTALIHAAAAGKWEACRLLLERGAQLNHTDQNGKTAIEWARQCYFVDVVRKLSEARSENYGDAVIERGQSIPVVNCGWGCGAVLRAHPKSIFSRSKTKQEIENEEDEEYVGYHERFCCPKRVVECPFGCGVKQLWAEELPEHKSEICPRRPIECPLGCGQQVEERFLDRHLNAECQKRRVRCMRCDEPVILEKMPMHDKSDCPMRGVECANGCGAILPWNLYSDHRRNHCPERLVRCRMCGLEKVAKFRDSHEQLHCSLRVVPCKWNCFDGIVYQKKVEHELQECNRRPVDCPNRCKAFVEARNLEKHLASMCVRRFVECELKCGLKVPEADMERHLKNECAERGVFCPHANCEYSKMEWSKSDNHESKGGPIKAKDLDEHVTRECDHRKIACGLGCGEKIPLSQLDNHKRFACTKRLATCRIGCPKQVPMDQLEEHEKHECRKRVMWCRFGCNETFPADKRNRHEKRECPKRFVLCSQGCGEEIREEDRSYHEKHLCLRRGKDGGVNLKL